MDFITNWLAKKDSSPFWLSDSSPESSYWDWRYWGGTAPKATEFLRTDSALSYTTDSSTGTRCWTRTWSWFRFLCSRWIWNNWLCSFERTSFVCTLFYWRRSRFFHKESSQERICTWIWPFPFCLCNSWLSRKSHLSNNSLWSWRHKETRKEGRKLFDFKRRVFPCECRFSNNRVFRFRNHPIIIWVWALFRSCWWWFRLCNWVSKNWGCPFPVFFAKERSQVLSLPRVFYSDLCR